MRPIHEYFENFEILVNNVFPIILIVFVLVLRMLQKNTLVKRLRLGRIGKKNLMIILLLKVIFANTVVMIGNLLQKAIILDGKRL